MLFEGLGAGAVALVAAAYFGGFLIRGAFGFGSNLPIVVMTAWLLGPHHAIVLVIITGVFAQAHLFPQCFGSANWRLVAMLTGGVYLGIAVGTYAFVSLTSETLAPILGAVVILIVAMDRFDAIGRLGRRIDLAAKPVVAPLSVASGLIGTVAGGGGIYFLAPFLRHMSPDAAIFRATNLALSGIFIFGRLGMIAVAGFVDRAAVLEAVALMPMAFLGSWAGGRWFHRVDAAHFFRALSLMLLLGAALLIGRSVL